jgi:hypothetical protein
MQLPGQSFLVDSWVTDSTVSYPFIRTTETQKHANLDQQ